MLQWHIFGCGFVKLIWSVFLYEGSEFVASFWRGTCVWFHGWFKGDAFYITIVKRVWCVYSF